jgi:hypothetical protein
LIARERAGVRLPGQSYPLRKVSGYEGKEMTVYCEGFARTFEKTTAGLIEVTVHEVTGEFDGVDYIENIHAERVNVRFNDDTEWQGLEDVSEVDLNHQDVLQAAILDTLNEAVWASLDSLA